MSRLTPALLALTSALSLAACAGQWPDWVELPRGYAGASYTPISRPHAYDRTVADERADMRKQHINAIAWQRTMDIALPDLAAHLDMAQPIALSTSGGPNPAALSASNYLREQLIERGFLLGVTGETSQIIDVLAAPSNMGKDMVDLTLNISRAGQLISSHPITAQIPGLVTESNRMPGFTTYPVAVPDAPVAPLDNDHFNN
jgi:hypothetical protein